MGICRSGITRSRSRKLAALVSHAAGGIGAASTVIPVIVMSNGVGAGRIVDGLVGLIEALALPRGTNPPMIASRKSRTTEWIGSHKISVIYAALHIGVRSASGERKRQRG